MIDLELVERFHNKWELNKDSGCWEWTAAKMGRGYGFIKIPKERKQVGAHRISYLIHIGEIPDGKLVCHTCDNPKCVRPSHLFLGTHKDNSLDMKAKDRHLRGTRNANSKLDDSKVRHIHALLDKGFSQGKVAKQYRVSQSVIFRIAHGRSWQHIYCEVRGAGTD